MSVRSDKLTFPGGHGQMLAARMDRPLGKPRGYALFAHCFTCSKDALAAARISTALAEKGIAVLRFDFTGLGGSEGDFANTNFSSNTDDLVAAAEYLAQEHQPPSLLIGHSLGGAAVLAASTRITSAAAVATIGAPADPAHLKHLLQEGLETIAREGEAEVNIGGRPFCIQKQFLDDISAQNLKAAIGKLRRALLVMHAPLDQTVAIDNASEIFLAAKHPKSFISLGDADHLLTRKEDAAYAAEVLAAWASRWFSESSGGASPALEQMEGEVIVSENGEGPFGQAILANGHTLRADEPESYGGRNTGPSPYDLLMAALGACTSMTLRMYADKKKWPLAKVTVAMNHAKIHAEDCEQCETSAGRIDRFERVVTVEGDLDGEQRSKLLEIADKCPVHRTLHSEVQVVTRLAE